MWRILLVDDHAICRRGLRDIIVEGLGKAQFGEAQNVQEALELLWKQEWDVVVTDITMPGRSGLDLLKEVKATRPRLPVIVLSVHGEDQFGVRVIRDGAAGFVTKETVPEELVRAIKKVLGGGRYVSSALAEHMAQYIEMDTSRPLHESLSDREYEVLRLIASGKTPTEIGHALSLSVKTISTYRARILIKLGMKTSAELTHYAIANHLVE